MVHLLIGVLTFKSHFGYFIIFQIIIIIWSLSESLKSRELFWIIWLRKGVSIYLLDMKMPSEVIMFQKVQYCIRTESGSMKQNRYRHSHQKPHQWQTAKQETLNTRMTQE